MAKGKERTGNRPKPATGRWAARRAASGKFVTLEPDSTSLRSREVVVLSREDYEQLVALAESRRSSEPAENDEDRADNLRADRILAELASGRDETISDAELGELLDAPTPLRFWRRKRGLTQAQLAAAVGTAQSHISAIEKSEVGASFETMRRIADQLAVSLDDLAG